MERVAVANQSDAFLTRITEVVVYGSFLRDTETLGDLDLACRLQPTVVGPNTHKVYKEHFRKSGRTYSRLGCEYAWAFEEVRLFLKNRRRTISLHDIQDFSRHGKGRQILLSSAARDPEKIARDLREYGKDQ